MYLFELQCLHLRITYVVVLKLLKLLVAGVLLGSVATVSKDSVM